MRLNRRVLLLLVALALAFAACGGSGSSGFDISSPLTEDEVIAAVVESGECRDLDGLSICRAESAAAAPGVPLPTPSVDPEIVFVRPQADALDCAPSPLDGGCELVVTFLPGSLREATYRIAVRGTRPPGGWIVAGDVAFAGGVLQAAVRVPPEVVTVQIAVLVFDGGRDAEPGSIESLAATGAAFAFVSGDVEIVAPGLDP